MLKLVQANRTHLHILLKLFGSHFSEESQRKRNNKKLKKNICFSPGVEAFITSSGGGGDESTQVATHFVDTLKDRINKVKEYDTELKTYAKANKTPKKRARNVDSDLQDFLK